MQTGRVQFLKKFLWSRKDDNPAILDSYVKCTLLNMRWMLVDMCPTYARQQFLNVFLTNLAYLCMYMATWNWNGLKYYVKSFNFNNSQRFDCLIRSVFYLITARRCLFYSSQRLAEQIDHCVLWCGDDVKSCKLKQDLLYCCLNKEMELTGFPWLPAFSN